MISGCLIFLTSSFPLPVQFLKSKEKEFLSYKIAFYSKAKVKFLRSLFPFFCVWFFYETSYTYLMLIFSSCLSTLVSASNYCICFMTMDFLCLLGTPPVWWDFKFGILHQKEIKMSPLCSWIHKEGIDVFLILLMPHHVV